MLIKSIGKKKMAKEQSDNSLYPIAVLIDELRNDDVNVSQRFYIQSGAPCNQL